MDAQPRFTFSKEIHGSGGFAKVIKGRDNSLERDVAVDVEFSHNSFTIIFQFIDGSTLRQIIQDHGPCPIGEARAWFHQLSSALDHAHTLGIVHRDIKPENIIIKPDHETAYLVDFGIALSAEEARKITKSGYVIGTPGYMSPEQQAG